MGKNDAEEDPLARSNGLHDALHKRHPHLTPRDVSKAANAIINRVSEAIASGNNIAIIEKDSDGKSKLRILSLRPRKGK